ncbi:MAG: MFS transporter permease [Desulfobacteraceae bacterium]|nr:MFS transporter permease [Desulfobacteraceae bacterium]
MVEEKLQEMVIAKEDAVFWMDRFGRWHNAGGPFKHKKIIDHFNSSIRYDKHGYFVEQMRDNVHEKVYFRYEETPIFVVDVDINEEVNLLLNTGEGLILKPEQLFVSKDNLYLQRGEQRIKFTERVLLKLAAYIEYDEGGYYFISGPKRHHLVEHR